MQWPFAEWGADAVLSGHDHNYERLLIGGIVYMVNGSGGDYIYPCNTVRLPGSVFCHDANFGAQKVMASDTAITFEFYSITGGGTLLDSYTIQAPAATSTPSQTITPSPALPGGTYSIDVRVSGSTNDAEERLSDGAMYLNSPDLEFTNDPTNWGQQNVGIRFAGINVPQGVTITNATSPRVPRARIG